MPSLRFVLDPEREGLGIEGLDPSKVVHLGDDAEIVVSGLVGGMQSGAPSMMFGFTLPDGRVVIAETSWALFKAAFVAFAGKFGEPLGGAVDTSGIALQYDPVGDGRTVQVDLVANDQPQWFQCELCGDRTDEPPGEEGAQRLAQWVHRHYREKHPEWPVPEVPGG